MIHIQLSGGLGNQMFQYAFAQALAHKQDKQKVCLDISPLQEDGYRHYELHHFMGSLPLLTAEDKNFFLQRQSNFFQKLKNKILPYYKQSLVKELYYHYDNNLLKINQDAVVIGYFQSEKYFLDIETKIRKDFRFKNPPKGANREMLRRIQETQAVSIHIRRGDFVGNPLHPLQSEQFFKEAISILQSKISNLHLFLFSNDIAWVREHLQFDIPYTIVDINDEKNGFEDMRLMSACKHHIIANSSFSWWGAWLNPDRNKIVIAPAKWVNSTLDYYKNVNDIIPESWIKI